MPIIYYYYYILFFYFFEGRGGLIPETLMISYDLDVWKNGIHPSWKVLRALKVGQLVAVSVCVVPIQGLAELR